MKSLVVLPVTLLSLIACPIVSGGPVVPAETIHVIDFEGLPAVPPPFGFSAVPVEAQLTDQFASLGILFRSDADYAAVVALGEGHATSGINGIGGVLQADPLEGRSHDELYLGARIDILFVDPKHPSQPGKTDFFSIRSDLISSGRVEATVIAFDAVGNELAREARADDSGQTWTLSVTGMSNIVLETTGAGAEDIAFDDVRFGSVAPVRAIPLPPALVPGALLLAGIIGVRVRRRSRGGAREQTPRATRVRAA